MTTLRRLMVADYPIRLILLVLAALGVAADVCAQSPIRVGYYDMTIGAGVQAEQEAPILAAGFTPVQLTNVTAADLASLHVLFVQNSSPNAYGSEYLASKAAVQDAVNAGLVLIIHDRFVGPSPAMTRNVLPLPAGVMPVVTRVNSQNNSVTDPGTLVANGPGGVVTETNLDGGMNSNMGFVNLGTVTIAGRVGLLHTTTANNSVTFSYPFGQGFVIYSSIPLDMFLKNMGTATQTVKDAFRNIYAPNVLAYAACGLKAFPATVTASSATGHYGGTTTLSATVKCGVLPAPGVTVTFSLNGGAVGSAQTDASGTATLTNASLGSSPASAIAVGTYATGVLANFGGASLFGASSATASLTVNKAPASIAVTGGTFVYDTTPHAAVGTVTGVFGESLGVPSFTYEDEGGVTTDVAPVNVGKYKVTASAPDSDNYLGTTDGSSAKIKITPASLVVTAHDKTKIYGAALPDFTAMYQGFVGDENAGILSGTLQLTTDATAASPVHQYAIEPSGVTARNYDIKFVAGVLAVTPAPLTVRAEDASKLYGAALPDFTATFNGFVLGETAGALDGSLHFTTEATAGSAVGLYAIVPSDLKSKNYTIAFVGGTLTVTPAPLTVRADDKTKVYGAALPALTASYEGFVLHDSPRDLAGTLALSTGATAASGVGEYAITPSGLASSNYAIAFVAGRLTVTPAVLTVRAEDKTKVYGAALPAFTARYEGFVLGDTPGSLGGTLVFTTNATVASHVGRYSITPSGLTSNNYSIAFANGYLLVTPAPLTIRADDKERLVGLPNPLLTLTYVGFVLGDNPTSLDTRPTVSTPAKLTSEDGEYPIVVRGAADADYTIEQIDGTLTLSPEGRMHGSGALEAADAKHKFDFAVRETIVRGEKGSLRLEVNRKKGDDDVFVSTMVEDVIFRDLPAVKPGGKAEADSVTITGVGRWNGKLATFEASATDNGEPGAGSDTFAIKIFAGGKMVYTTSGTTKNGNIQSNRLRRR